MMKRNAASVAEKCFRKKLSALLGLDKVNLLKFNLIHSKPGCFHEAWKVIFKVKKALVRCSRFFDLIAAPAAFRNLGKY
jgi:hypothetical protein